MTRASTAKRKGGIVIDFAQLAETPLARAKP
jgi:aryl carrier-like protein